MTNLISRKIISGEAWNSFSYIFSKPIALINSFIIIGALSLYEFGVYKLVFSFYSLMSIFSVDFLENLVVNEMNIHKGSGAERKSFKIFKEFAIVRIFLGLVLTVLVFIFSGLISSYYQNAVGLWIKMISVLFLIDAIKSIFTIFLKFNLNFKITSISDFLYELFKLIIFFFFYFFVGINTTFVILSAIIASFLLLLFLVSFSFKGSSKEHYNIIFSFQEEERLLVSLIKKYGPWSLGKNIAQNISQNLRPWIIKWFLGTEAVAVFSVALSFLGNLKGLFSFNTLNIFLPRLSSEKDGIVPIYFKGIKYSTLLYFIVGIFGAVAVPLITNILFPKYWQSIPYFYLLLISILFYGFYAIVGKMLYAFNYQKELFILSLYNLLLVSFVGFSLVSTLGLLGASLEFVITQIVISILFYKKLIYLKPEFKIDFKKIFIFNKGDFLFFKNILKIYGTNNG